MVERNLWHIVCYMPLAVCCAPHAICHVSDASVAAGAHLSLPEVLMTRCSVERYSPLVHLIWKESDRVGRCKHKSSTVS